MKHVRLCSFMPQYGWYVGNSKDFSGMNIWNMSIYVHLCCSMVFFDNSKDFSGMKFWKTYIYVHLCCSMGDIVIIQKILVGWNLKHVHVFPFMLQYGWHFHNSKQIRKKTSSRIEKIFYVYVWYILCTRFFSIPEDTLKRIFFNSIFYVPV